MRHRFRLGGDEERSVPLAGRCNPARILKSDIKIIARYGRMERPDEAPDTKGSNILTGLENTFEQH